jgi:S1-C subfamily serine protease
MEGATRPLTLDATALPSVRAERVTALRGLQVITVDPEVRAERGLASESGAMVVGVEPRVAVHLGVQPGDVIVRMNGSQIRSAEDLAGFFEGISGQQGWVEVDFVRRGRLGRRRVPWGG